jgi:ABC-type antimicrobial peptide transport system permease subunit
MAALLLSAIGLYAVIAFAVSQRTREIAVRMAIGARGPGIVGRFVVDGVRLGAFGLMLGLPASLAGLRALAAVDSDFPLLPVLPVATIAAWLPARRAASVDPAVTLRAE